MHTLTCCPICKNEAIGTFLESKDFFLTGEEFSISVCRRCGIKFTNPRPDKDEIGRYYSSSAYLSHAESSRSLIGKLFYAARKITLKEKYKLIKKHHPGANILDIGSGTGEFLAYCRKKGCQVTGVEPSGVARKLAQEKHCLDVYENLNLLPSEKLPCDVITLWHVLEHFHDPLEQLQKIYSLLNKDGILVVAVPNNRSYDAWLYGKYWAAYDLPRHLFHFDEPTLIHLLYESSFRPVGVYPQKFDAFYISMLSEKYKKGRNNYLRAGVVGLVSNLSGSMGKREYSSFMLVAAKG